MSLVLAVQLAVGLLFPVLMVVMFGYLLGGVAIYLLGHVAIRLRGAHTWNTRRLVLALVLIFATDVLLQVSGFMMAVSIFTITLMTFAIAGLALFLSLFIMAPVVGDVNAPSKSSHGDSVRAAGASRAATGRARCNPRRGSAERCGRR